MIVLKSQLFPISRQIFTDSETHFIPQTDAGTWRLENGEDTHAGYKRAHGFVILKMASRTLTLIWLRIFITRFGKMNHNKVSLVWIPSHFDIIGYEAADSLAMML